MKANFNHKHCLLILALAFGGTSYADSTQDSQASLIGTSQLIQGNAEDLANAAIWSVDSIQRNGSQVLLILRSTAGAASQMIKLSLQGSGKVSLVAGQSIEVSTTAVGYILSQSGRVVAFIPKQLGQTLLHHARYP